MTIDDKYKTLAQYGILIINCRDDSELYDSYMPFIKGGGVFVFCDNNYQLHDELFLLISLPDSDQIFAVAGQVVWITAGEKMGKYIAGVGVQMLGEEGEKLNQAVISLLGEQINSPLPTATM
ncbi:MAG: pilus assembly protein PilZ [Gammaproteobacteria bacterium]|nr:MAG: pilus assembly protein PilZ [Gammaproteobacteria bacterium]